MASKTAHTSPIRALSCSYPSRSRPLSSARYFLCTLAAGVVLALFSNAANGQVRRVVFEGARSEHKWVLKDLNSDLPSDWSPFEYLVLEFRHSSPQRFYLFVYDKGGPRRVVMQPYGQGVWIRASVPLKYFQRRDYGNQMAAVNNRGTNSFWMSVWGPFGSINAVEALGVTMEYPLHKPVLEIRSVRLAKADPGSDILEKLPVVDRFGQWIHAEWPRKIRSLEQLRKEWTEEETALKPGDFGYCKYGGYLNTKAKATGFFRVEKINGKWWFVDPDGHLFLSTNVFGLTLGFPSPTENRKGYFAELPPGDLLGKISIPGLNPSNTALFHAWNLQRRYGPDWRAKAADMEIRRMEAWGLTTGPGLEIIAFGAGDPAWKPGKPYLSYLRVPLDTDTTFLGLPDVYSEQFARAVDAAAAAQLAPRKNDPLVVGHFVGNEPPWPGRESELVDMILAGPATATQRELKSFLATADTLERRQDFVRGAFEKYLRIVGEALHRNDPNHLNLGMRFGGQPPDYLIRMGRYFDVISFNPYEYSPVEHMQRAYKLLDRPMLFGEFQFGVPENGLGGSLVQTASQIERGIAYRYYMEQAASFPAFVGASWFTGVDQPVISRTENYNIGFLDVTDRPYPEMVEALIEVHRRLLAVHSGKAPPFNRLPQASEAGTPSYRLSDAF
jgi:hypothetical protein